MEQSEADMRNSRLHAGGVTRLSESMHFSPDGPGIWVGSRKYFRQDEVLHEHDFFELVLVRSGSGLHVTEEGEYTIVHGNIFLIRPGCAHGYRDMNRLEIVNILYLPERLKFEMYDLREIPVMRFILPGQPSASSPGNCQKGFYHASSTL